jgi:glycolate oxidase FAD binding subunit
MTPPSKLEEVFSPAQISERDGKPFLSPQTTEEISAITRYANQHSLAIEITGAGTKRTWGNPVTADILLSTTHLTGVLSHSWQDLTATVAAGTPWSAMQRVLAQHNQQVALDPLWPETATIGGILSTNDSGALRLKYGSLRDLIIGMTIVLADSTIAKSGGKVVKNVAGYDLHKLMTGAFGTLGIITEVTFRLHPLPQHTQTFTVSAPQAVQLAGLMHSIHDSHLLAQALQLRGDSNGGFHLDIQLNAHPDAKQPEALQKMAEAAGRQLTQAPADLWIARKALFQNGATTIKLSVLPTELCEYLDHMQLAPDVEVACVAQSSGLIFASLEGTPAAIENYIASSRTDLTVLATSTNMNRWKADPNALPLMREIKRQFDPNHTLNPGRFLGGI